MTTAPNYWTAPSDVFEATFAEINRRFPSYFQEAPYDDHYAVWLFLTDRFLARTVHATKKKVGQDYPWYDDYRNGLTPEESCHRFFDQRVESFFNVYL